MVEKWDPGPLGPPGFLGSPESPGPRRTPWDPENLPGTTLGPPVFLRM